jgi:hypothetical protein
MTSKAAIFITSLKKSAAIVGRFILNNGIITISY